MNETLAIRRIDYRTYELSMDGRVVTLRNTDIVDEFPRCFMVVDQLFCAAKAAACCLPECQLPSR